MVAGQLEKWKRNCVERHRHQRFGDILQAPDGMTVGILPAQQSPPNKNASFAAFGRDIFKNNSLITPNELVARFNHSPKEIDVAAAGSKLRKEYRIQTVYDSLAK